MTHQIKVTNKNAATITDFFDGIAYHFEPNKPMNVDLAAATHIFGIDFPPDAEACSSEDIRSSVFYHLQKRWGWNSTKPEEIKAAAEKFANITFTPIVLKTVEIVSRADQEVAEPRAERAEKKGGKFKPRADEAESADEEEVA